MAIVVEEGKNKVNSLKILSWIVIIVVIFFGTYYIFFRQPEVIDIVTPSGFEDTSRISRIVLDPETIENDSVFKSLKSYITVPESGESGRANPFTPF